MTRIPDSRFPKEFLGISPDLERAEVLIDMHYSTLSQLGFSVEEAREIISAIELAIEEVENAQ